MKPPNVLRKVLIDGKWLLLPVAKGTAGERDFSRVLHLGQPLVVTAGTFYLQYREGGKRVTRAVGDHPRDAKAAITTQTGVLGLRARGVVVEDAPQIRAHSRAAMAPVKEGPTVASVVADFLASSGFGLRPTSFAKYRNAMDSFRDWAAKHGRREIEQLRREDLLAFMDDQMRVQGLDVSTAIDKAVIVLTRFKRVGAKIVMGKGDWPRRTERQPEVYRPEVLRPLFAEANAGEFAVFQTFLLSGMRDQEVGFLAWEDFDPKRSTLRVTAKKAMGFTPKNYQERTVPVPGELVRILAAHRKTQAEGEYLIFPTSATHNKGKGLRGGQRDRHMLDKLKLLALRAGLNCGRCRTVWRGRPAVCSEAPVCGQFGLHKFRHTYATTLLHSGVDLLSVQKLLGHKDLDSTRKYLRALEPEDLLAKINLTSLATRFV